MHEKVSRIAVVGLVKTILAKRLNFFSTTGSSVLYTSLRKTILP